jgi:hypothetical protein
MFRIKLGGRTISRLSVGNSNLGNTANAAPVFVSPRTTTTTIPPTTTSTTTIPTTTSSTTTSTTSTTLSAQWILATGMWNDSGVWIDSANWID